jgi:hypothetical protein
MKAIRWKTLPFLFVLILTSCTGCEEPDPTVLHAETQTGKNTFGCYVNNELYVGGFSNLMGPKPLEAIYNKTVQKLKIISIGRIEDKYQQIINIEVSSPVVDSTLKITQGNFESQDIHQYKLYSFYNSGEIYFTKLDTVSKIVSGRFSFIGKNLDLELKPGTDSIIVTNGRFDLKLTIIN